MTMDLLTIAKQLADRVEAESWTQHVPVAVTVIDSTETSCSPTA